MIQFLPSWVEPDPLRGKALDALGLQATADNIADEILPGISSLTTRARYYSLLCWARQKCGDSANEEHIHRLEVALSVRESHLHANDSKGDKCRFLGSRNLRQNNQPKFIKPPPKPRDAYKTPAWRNYRASMRSLGLLDQNNALTELGKQLAGEFGAANCRANTSGKVMLPESACLSRISKNEARTLAEVLGINKKGKIAINDKPPESTRRACFEREMRMFKEGKSLSDVLAEYEIKPEPQLSRTGLALREAAIWERLSLGLNAIFLMWLHNIGNSQSVVEKIEAARRSRGESQTAPAEIVIDENAAVNAIKSIRRAIRLKKMAVDTFSHCDMSAFDLGQKFIGNTPVKGLLEQLRNRHRQAKGDDAWFRQSASGGWELARDAGDTWELPKTATMHGYRFAAFGQIIADIRGAK